LGFETQGADFLIKIDKESEIFVEKVFSEA